jgi:hypothetical protein
VALAGDVLLWMELSFERDAIRMPVKVRLRLDAESTAAPSASVEFDGWDVTAAFGDGESPHEALTQAIRVADATLDTIRASGLVVSLFEHGWGFQPFGTLSDAFAFRLADFAPKPDAEIISGPTPSSSGDVIFIARVEDRQAQVLVSIDGFGVKAGHDIDDWNIAMRLVSQLLEGREKEKLAWCIEAANLRRAAGQPRPHDFPRLPSVVVVGDPISGHQFVELVIDGVAAGYRILFSRRGGILDECDHWPSLPEPARNAAFATAVDYALANRSKMAAAGLDMDLFEALYA